MNRENQILNVRVDEIIPNRFQPRLAFNEEELKALSESIKIHGIIQPLVLRRIGDKFEIIAGERRYKAARLAGLSTVPAIIMNMNDKESAEVAVVENLQRKNLTAIEEAQSFKKILDMGYATQEQLAERMGVTQPTIANKLRLLNLEKEVQDALLRNQISERHARSLLCIPDRDIQVNMLNRIMRERLTVKQTDDEINKIIGKTISPIETPTQPLQDNDSTSNINKELINNNSTIPNITNTNLTQQVRQTETPEQRVSNELNSIRTETHERKEAVDFASLLRKESDTVSSPTANREQIRPQEDINRREMAINPFQEETPEIMKFEVPTQNNTISETPETSRNNLIEEFRKENPQTYTPNTNIPHNTGISKAINAAREEVRKIESLGFKVDTEEFDFEDMYQIIIKIQKD